MPQTKKFFSQMPLYSNKKNCYILDGNLPNLLPILPKNSHKNTFGHVLILGGSQGMGGAAHLAARSALRSGAGLVTAAAPNNCLNEIKNNFPEIMTLSLGEKKWPAKISKDLQQLILKCSAIIIGPGLKTNNDSLKFLAAILSYKDRPVTIIDADAINLIALNPNFIKYLTKYDILTPHPAEAARLLQLPTKIIQDNRFNSLAKLCNLSKSIFILKGANCLIGQYNKPTFICPYDIAQLAIAGSGDVLAGILGSLIAQNHDQFDNLHIVCKAVMYHILTGLYAKKNWPERGNLASELADLIPNTLSLLKNIKPTNGIPWPKSL